MFPNSLTLPKVIVWLLYILFTQPFLCKTCISPGWESTLFKCYKFLLTNHTITIQVWQQNRRTGAEAYAFAHIFLALAFTTTNQVPFHFVAAITAELMTAGIDTRIAFADVLSYIRKRSWRFDFKNYSAPCENTSHLLLLIYLLLNALCIHGQ